MVSNGFTLSERQNEKQSQQVHFFQNPVIMNLLFETPNELQITLDDKTHEDFEIILQVDTFGTMKTRV